MTDNNEAKEMMNEFEGAWTKPLRRAAAEIRVRLDERRDRLMYLEQNFDQILERGEMEPEQLWDAIDVLRFQIPELKWVLGEK